MTDAVHTPAPTDEADMFDGTEAAPPGHAAGPCIEVTGVLISAAEVRTKTVGIDQHPVPVLCLDIAPLSGARRTVHAEQIYTEATRKQAEARAAALPKGTRITLTTPIADMRVIFPHVQSVAVQP